MNKFNKLVYLVQFLFLIVLKQFNVRLYVSWFAILLRRKGVVLTGEPRFISPWVRFDIPSRISIGALIVISDNVTFLNHDYSLTTALRAAGNAPPTDMAFVKNISIGNNVFIGMNCLILPGTILGDNTIVGAGSVVKGVFEPDVVLIGNPAKIIAKVSELGGKWRDSLPSRELIIDSI